jgi:outer membrane protein assembly factor BamB
MKNLANGRGGFSAFAARALLASLLACCFVSVAQAADYELRLVPYDDPDKTVDKRIEKQVVENNETFKEYLAWVGEQPVAGKDVSLPMPQVCWANNITLDNKPVFEIYEQGKYIDRLPVARPLLAAGKHTLWPGDHVFVVQADGAVKTDDPDLIVETQKLDGDRVRHIVKIKCYPVTLKPESSVETSGRMDSGAESLALPNLTLRDAAEKARELLPQIFRFRTLTVWLPANTNGAGYLIHPLKETFHLSAKGIDAGAGGGHRMPTWKVGQWEIAIPLQPISVYGIVNQNNQNNEVLVTGMDKLSLVATGGQKGRPGDVVRRRTWLYARGEPYEFRVSDTNLGPGLLIDGDLSKLPNKVFSVEWSDSTKLYQRGILAETDTRHIVTGRALRARVRGLDCTMAIKAGDSTNAVPTTNVVGNLLADAVPFARLQARDALAWEDLPVAPASDGLIDITLPVKAIGIYRLRLGLHPRAENRRDIFVDQWVTVAPKDANGIGLFTKRGRTAFFRGESFWIAVAVTTMARPFPAGSELRVDLAGPDGKRVSLFNEKTAAAIDRRETFILEVSPAVSQALAPGRYTLEARLGDLTGPALLLDLTEPSPETHFTNLLPGKYNNLGKSYGRVLGGGADADEVVRAIVGSGYNTFKGMTYAMDRVQWTTDWPTTTAGSLRMVADEINSLARERPEIGPWEAVAPMTGRDRFLDAAVRHNLRFFENLFTYHDAIMPRGDKMLDGCDRYATLETESMLHSPAFRGACLYDELSQSMDHDGDTPMRAYFFQADELAYRRKTGRTSSEALRAFNRFMSRPEGQRRYQDVADYRTWPMHLDDQWKEFSARLAGSIKRVMPGAVNFSLARMNALPGGCLQGGDPGTREGISQPLEAASAVGYKDMGGHGEWPVAAALGADVLRTRDGLLVWPMLNGSYAGPYGAANLRQAFFALSQKCDGLTFMQFETTPDASWGDNFNGVRDITTSLTTRYGDLFLASEKGYKQVAILFSREMDLISGSGLACETIWTACMRAGYPADILTTTQLAADKGMPYRVVFVPGIAHKEAVPPEMKAALKRLLTAGKIVAVERNSRLDLDGVVRVDSDFDELDDRSGGTFPKYLDNDDERWWDMSKGTTQVLKAFLAKHVPPAAEHDLLVGPDWLRCRAAEYLVIPNFAFTGFRGNHKTYYVAPDTAVLRFPKRPPVCYDMLEMKRLDPGLDGTNMTLTLDMTRSPGKIVAFLPAEIASLEVRAPRTVQAGKALSYSVHAADSAGRPIDAGIPIEITLSAAASDRNLLKVYRAATPEYRDAYAVPVVPQVASLSLQVRELISGRSTKVTIAVTPGELPPVARDTHPVRMYNVEEVRRFLDQDAVVSPTLFTTNDILNIGGLAIRLHGGKDPFTQHVRSRLAPATLKLLDDYAKKHRETPELATGLVVEFNRLIEGESLFSPERFPAGSLSVAAAGLAGTTKSKGALPDLNRLLLEETYSREIVRRPPLYVAVEAEWMQADAERLAASLRARGLRVRATALRNFVSYGGVLTDEVKGAPICVDGTRLWRGDIIRPGMFLDGPVILLGAHTSLIDALAARTLLPEPVTENFPGPGKAVVCRVVRAFSNYHDTLAVLAEDGAGLAQGVDALLKPDPTRISPQPSRPTVASPAFEEQAGPAAVTDAAQDPQRFADLISHGDRIETIRIDVATGRIVVGTFGFGHNLFCFDKDGKLLWKVFLPEHDVYLAQWYDDGRRILAATSQGFDIFMLDGKDGKILRKFASTEWPDFHVDEREVRTKVDITFNLALRQILVFGRTGLLAVDYDGNKMWFHDRAFASVDYPTNAVQTAFASFGNYIQPLSAVGSPDGSKIAYNEFRYFASTPDLWGTPVPLWRNEPQILDARTGKMLLHNKSDPGASTGEKGGGWQITWPAGSESPWITAPSLSATLLFAGKPGADGTPDPGKLGAFMTPPVPQLKTGGRLKADEVSAARLNAEDNPVWQTHDDRFWVTELDRLAEGDTRLYRCSRDGLVRCLDMETGKTLWEHKLAFVARLEPAPGTNLIAGTYQGELLRFGPNGEVIWDVKLRNLHDIPAKDYAQYVAQANPRDRDDTEQMYPISRDKPGDYKEILRFGLNQVDNGDFESADGWSATTGTVERVGEAHSGAQSLLVKDGQLVTQAIRRRTVVSATYLLEFFYRVDAPTTRLTAGAQLMAPHDVFTLSTFSAPSKKWTFARLAVKTMADTTNIVVGFEATGGRVNVDGVTFRPIRFPSANLLANAELQKIEPTHPTDFRVQYNSIPGTISQQLLNQNNVAAFLQSVPLGAMIFKQPQAYLQNGRLDDIGTMWCYRPDPMGFAVALTRPAYVSHLVIYLNNATPDLGYPFISILANDLTIKIPRTVAMVRGNRRRFIVVHFPQTLYTDSLKILPGKSRTQRDTITEVEVYGPVGGPSTMTQKTLTPDPLATAMFMGNPSHVPAALPDDFVGKYVNSGLKINKWPSPSLNAGAIVADGSMAYSQATGSFIDVPVTDEAKKVQEAAREEAQKANRPYWAGWRTGSVTPLTTPARYGGRLIAGSADYKMHAVADNGAHIWAFETGGRVYSSPAPKKDEVYFGSDDGRLYRVDVDSGVLIWEFKTGDRIRTSPALDDKNAYFASWDGFLYAVDMEQGVQAWKAPIAPFSISSPAIQNGRVYVGDEAGALHCFEAATGKAVWQVSVGDRISVCPVVTPEGVFVAADNGKAALIGFDGKPIWQRVILTQDPAPSVPVRLTGQPFATKTQVVLTTTTGVIVLNRLGGTPDARFIAPFGGNFVSAVPYGDRLCLIQNGISLQGVLTRFIVGQGGAALVWKPETKGDSK